ncbi:MAG: NAD kinase [Bacteroidetes bacterium]|nr:NAD kinase [Bacteroidota bacterium]NOG56342.1 NAD kinase [Bacteroidota bacterium]
MKIAIYGKSIDEEDITIVCSMLDKIERVGAEVTLHQRFYNALRSKNVELKSNVQVFQTHQEIKNEVQFLFSLGGDGTFLDTISLVKDSNIPILGINTGRLGFLSTTATSEIETAIDAISKGEFQIEKRSLIELEDEDKIFGDECFALNEISVLKKDTSSMINIEVELDGIHLNTYWTDGLIISTATGSTAYSLSCGGPILMPGSGNFVLTPIAPHNLNVRPIVINDHSILKLKVEGRADRNLVALDSRSKELKNGATILVKKAKHQISIVHFTNDSFIQSLRNKLNWGLDKRNI